MNIGTLLQNSANGFMAAIIAKRVSSDVVRQVPYPAIALAAILGAIVGVMLSRRRHGARP